jgi:hypothetical protein
MVVMDGKVIWHVTMSLDGFVAAPDHDMDWMSLSWLPTRAEMPEPAVQVLASLGAILGGRGWYEARARRAGAGAPRQHRPARRPALSRGRVGTIAPRWSKARSSHA